MSIQINGYENLSAYYDRLTSDVAYTLRADYLLRLFSRFRGVPQTVLDLACGSGNISRELAARGIEVIGADASAEMLMLAREKSGNEQVMFVCQDMRELDLYGTVEGAVCVLDGLNHLLTTEDVRAALHRLHYFVEPGGLFIFDVNTPYKHRTVLADNVFVQETDGLMCVWQNRPVSPGDTVEMRLDFFEQDGDAWWRSTDVVRERAYSEATLRKLLKETGFETLAVFGDMTEEPPSAQEQRMIFVSRRGE